MQRINALLTNAALIIFWVDIGLLLFICYLLAPVHRP